MGTSVVRGLWCRTEILFTGCHAMYLYVKCTFMSSVPLYHMYLYVKCTFMSNVPLCQMYLYVKRFYVKCTFIANVPLWQMFLCQMYLYVKWFYVKCFMWNEFMSNDIMSNITDPTLWLLLKFMLQSLKSIWAIHQMDVSTNKLKK